MGSRGGNTDHRKIDQTGYKYNQKSLPTERIIDGHRYQAHSRGFQGHTDRQELQAYRYQPSTSLSPRRAPGPASSPNRNDAGIRLGKYLRQSMDPYGQPSGADPFDDGSSSACSAYAKSSVPSSSSDSVHPPSMVCSETSSVSTWENSSSQPSESLTESGNKKPIKVVTSTSKMVEVAPGIRMRLRGVRTHSFTHLSHHQMKLSSDSLFLKLHPTGRRNLALRPPRLFRAMLMRWLCDDSVLHSRRRLCPLSSVSNCFSTRNKKYQIFGVDWYRRSWFRLSTS